MKRKKLMLNYLDWYSNDILLLRLAGLYCVDENGEIIRGQFVYSLFINCFLLLIGNVSQTINLFMQKQDVITIAASAYVVFITWLCTLNFFYLFKHRKLLARLFADLNNEIFQPTTKKSIDIVRRSYLLYKNVKTGLLIICTTAVLISVITPSLRKNESVEMRFPMKLWYPFDITVFPTYEIIYFYNCFLNISSTLINIYLQIMVAAFTTFISAQCDLICYNMETTTNLQSIKRFIFHHQSIVDFAKRAETAITDLYLYIFAASNISICMTLFLLKVVERFSFEFFFLLMYSCGITFQMLLPCWFSSEMKRKSEKIPFYVYSLPWQDAPNHLKKDVFFLLASSQEYIILQVKNLFPLSVDTFVKLLKSSFSYYTVLNDMNAEDE